MSRLLIISCTTKKRPEDTLIHKSIEQIDPDRKSIDLIVLCNNRKGLPEAYNQFIHEKMALWYEYIAFVHDDVWIDDPAIEDKLSISAIKYDIVGVAGGLSPKIQHPALWHIMSNKIDHRGQAGHFVNQQNTEKFGEPCYMTSFGMTPSRVAIVDGVFVAINLRVILDKGWKWNENFTFHHYDIASCIDANKLGLRIGVYPINIYHASPGLKSLEDPVWSASNKKFLELYA